MNDALIVRVTGENGRILAGGRLGAWGFIPATHGRHRGEWFWLSPLFGSFLRQRCQWELAAAELPGSPCGRGRLDGTGFSHGIHHALAAGDAQMLRDILLNHAWGCLITVNMALLEESLKALPWESLLENPRLVLLQAADASQHRYSRSECVAGAREQDPKGSWTARCMLNLTRCAPVAINDGNPEEAERLAEN